MEEELGLIGASAEDTEAELIRNICETELLAGKEPNLNTLNNITPPPQFILQSFYKYHTNTQPPSPLLSRGEPAECIPSPAGESLRLPRTLFPPPAHHCCLSGTLSVHDD